ncbi:MAG: maltose ABC transporter permease MalF [Pelomonas sp.]|nr:maltose ABC transporter permease MalF [Burkholderiaceae bacterium]MBV8605094.1 maltose ABC transporter permease MalF [Roseateles sp.]
MDPTTLAADGPSTSALPTREPGSRASRHGLRPPTAWERAGALLRWPLIGAAALVGLYLVFTIYVSGQTVAAALLLAMLAGSFYLFMRGSLPYRYLYPGVMGMAVFIALPLVYTAVIGFSNYSSAHLLDEQRVRGFLLEQHEVDEAHTLGFTVHADGPQFRLALRDAQGAVRFVSPALALRASRAPVQVPMLDAHGEALPLESAGLMPELGLRELIQHRQALAQLVLHLPAPTAQDQASAQELHYLGLREFGPVRPHFAAQPDGSLLRLADGERFAPDRSDGVFRSATGEALQPGFRVMVGLRNYARMLFDAEFRGPFLSIFVWTVVFSLATVACATAIGMLLAVLMNWEDLRGRGVYRTLLFLPYAVPGFISILVFKGLFNQNFGEINAILDALFGVKPAWFANPLLAKLMLVIVNVWLGYPYIMILCSGLLKAIPVDLYEASALAGAGPWTNFRHITAPLIIRPLAPLLVSAFAFNFNNFVLIALLTDGRPDFLSSKLPAGQTDILVSYTYRIAFRDSGSDFGLAAAISTLIFVLVAAMSLINLRLMKKAQA